MIKLSTGDGRTLAVCRRLFRRCRIGELLRHCFGSVQRQAQQKKAFGQHWNIRFAIPGWRVGYSAAPRAAAKAISSIQGHITSAATSLSQWGALYAMEGAQESVSQMVEEYKKRMELTGEKLSQIPEIRFNRPQGTFYYFVDMTKYLGRRNGDQIITSSNDLATYILEKGHVAVVPGEAFDMGGCLRISFSNSQENIARGIDRLADALSELQEA